VNGGRSFAVAANQGAGIMNLAEFSINNRLICGLVIVGSLIGGWVAYDTMPRFEDPEFTIRTAQVFTEYPGATPKEVANEGFWGHSVLM